MEEKKKDRKKESAAATAVARVPSSSGDEGSAEDPKKRKKREKKLKKIEKKTFKQTLKAEKRKEQQRHVVEAHALRTSFDEFIFANPLKRVLGTNWNYLDLSDASGAASPRVPRAGADGKAVMVFLPSAAIAPQAYFELFFVLRKRFRILAINVSGVGLPLLDDYVAGVKLVLDQEKVTRAHFFGFGFGGVVAHSLLQREPKLFQSLILAYSSPQNAQLGAMFKKVALSQKVDKFRNSSPHLLRFFIGFHLKVYRDEPELPEEEQNFWQNVLKNFAVPLKNGDQLQSYFEILASYHSAAAAKPTQFPGNVPILLIDTPDENVKKEKSEKEKEKEPTDSSSDVGPASSATNIAGFQHTKEYLALHPHATVHPLKNATPSYFLVRGKAAAEFVTKWISEQKEDVK